jgi:hypothetical protein
MNNVESNRVLGLISTQGIFNINSPDKIIQERIKKIKKNPSLRSNISSILSGRMPGFKMVGQNEFDNELKLTILKKIDNSKLPGDAAPAPAAPAPEPEPEPNNELEALERELQAEEAQRRAAEAEGGKRRTRKSHRKTSRRHRKSHRKTHRRHRK